MSLNDGGLIKYLFTAESTSYFIFFVIFSIAVIAASYLLGSINSAIIISKVVYHDDVRLHGSGNPGLTNMLRTFGGAAAGLTLLGDFMKTAISITIAGVLFGFNYVGGVSTGFGMCYVAGLFAVIGHIAPIYYKFKGGKGVLTTAVTALILTPIPFLILFAMFATIVAISKYVSLGSVISAVFYPVILHAYFSLAFDLSPATPGLASLSTIVIAILIVYCHRGNLQRISNRTERKISFGKKSAPKEEPVAEAEEDDGSEE